MSKKTNLIGNNEAVAEVLGTVMILAVLVTFFTMLQVSVVPDWNKKVEVDHIPVAYDDMMTLKSDLEDVATLDVTKSSDINLGARYPDRMIFLNPGPGAPGTLTVEDNVTITIEYGTASQIYKSSRITYELHGMNPKIVYEHGIIIRDYGNNQVIGPIPPENHSLYDDETENIYIPIVSGTSFSVSSLDSKSLNIFPLDTETPINDPGHVTITMDTNYPGVWDKILVNTDDTTVDVSGDVITIESDVIEQIQLPEIEVAEMYGCAIYSGIARLYKTPPSSGGGGSGGGLAGNITEDTSNISVSTGDDAVLGLKMTNDGDRTIAIEFMRIAWTPDLGEYVSSIELNSVKVTGSSAIHSETWIPLTDDGTPPARLIDPGETIDIDIDFGGTNPNMHDKYVTIECLLSEGSIKTITFTTPAE